MKIGRLGIILFLTLFVVSCAGKQTVKPAEKFDPEKVFARANEELEKKEYEKARASFLEVKSRDLTKKLAPQAQLKIADTYVREEEPDLAIAEYRKFLDSYPDNQYASYAQYQIAMVYFNQIEGPERGYGGAARALAEFEKLKKMFPRNPYKEVVDLQIEKCKNIIAEYEFLVGKYYFSNEAYTAALGRFEGLLKKFPGYKKEPDVLYYTGISYKKEKQKEKAAEYFARLVDKYPSNKLSKDAKKELSALKSK